MKNCTKCGKSKPSTEFGKDARKRDGLRFQCKSCTSIAGSEYRAANHDKVLAATAKWAAANQDKLKAKDAKWRSANPERYRTTKAKWYAGNPEACRIHSHNRRARVRNVGGALSTGLAEKLFRLQRGKCACGCGQPLGEDYHRDHRMPLALGGSNTDDNIQLLRNLCNLQKGAKHPIDFMRQRGFLL